LRISVPYFENYDIIFIYFMVRLFEVRTQKALSANCIKYSKTVTGTDTAAKLCRQINGILNA